MKMLNLHTIALPGKEYPKETLPGLYEQLLRENGIHTQAQIASLREEVIEYLMSLQDAIIAQNAADIMAGKYTDEADMAARMPLYRNSDTIRNIPEDIMKWHAFTAWLNDRIERGWVN